MLTTIGAIVSTKSFAQTETDTVKTVNIREVVISANKYEDNRLRVSQQVALLPSSEIRFQNPQTTADLLQNSGSVFVQKSQGGAGSPVIRGFEASRVVLVVDGVRMNNLIYRAGHLQDIITTDPFTFDRVEVLYGPSSTMYGSDALGGVVHMFTKQPRLSLTNKTKVNANAALRYATANQEMTAHVDANIGGKRWASFTSFTVSDFGDITIGKSAGGIDSVWGKRNYYVERINGQDSLVKNDDPYKQVFTGYTQYNVLQKVLFKPSPTIAHQLNVQYSTSSNVPRYDRLTDLDPNDVLRNADWYYGPQEHLLIGYSFRSFSDSSFFNSVNGGVSFQKIQESRHQRRFGRPYLQNRIEDVNVIGYDLDLMHRRAAQTFRFGFEGQMNYLNSTAFNSGVETDTAFSIDTRYPNGANSMETWALYVTHEWNLGEKLVFNDGLRLEYIHLFSQFDDTTVYAFNIPVKEITQTNIPVSGNIGLTYLPTPRTKIAGLISTGFRAPNIDDLTKLFESTSSRLIVPNPDIKPEQTLNFELNVTKFIGERVRWENVGFYTLFRDAIVVDRFAFNGEPTVIYNGDTADVYAPQNKQRAYITGFNSNIQADITSYLAASGSITYTYGRIKTDTVDIPLDHIPPVFGRVGLRYHDKKLTAEAYTVFNGWKRIEDYYPNGEDNEAYATSEGMPGWYTINFKASYTINKYIALQAGVENILDLNYRTFASGVHAPGRNIFGTLRLSI